MKHKNPIWGLPILILLAILLARRGWSGERAMRAAREALDRTGGGDSARGSRR